MNRNTILIIVAIVLGGAALWYLMPHQAVAPMLDEQAATSTAETATTTTSETVTKPGTAPKVSVTPSKAPEAFKSIFAQKASTECKYEQVQSNSRTSSVIQIADGKMRAEFRTTGLEPSANLMVYANGILYSWQEGASTGKKSTIRTIEDLPAVIPRDLTSGASFGTNSNNVGWDCHPWAKNAALLTPPAYVKFQ